MNEDTWEQNTLAFLANLNAPSSASATAEAGKLNSVALMPLATQIAQPAPAVATAANRVPVAERVETKVFVREVKPKPGMAIFVRPKYVIDMLPYFPIDPAPAAQPPVRAGEFMLWPNPAANFAFFALVVPRLVDFSLTAQVEFQADHSLRTTGGSATLIVCAYPADNLQAVQANRQAWADSLAAAGHGRRDWRFEPLNLRELQAGLDLPAGHTRSAPQVSVSTSTGTASYMIDLSEVGALTWRDALNAQQGGSIPGVCRLTANYYSASNGNVNVQNLALTAGLGQLLNGRGPGDVHTVNPQQTVESRLVVAGHDLIESIAVTLSPSIGQAPESRVFDSQGGQVNLSITTQDPNSVEIGWTAAVRFRANAWPIIPASGRMAFRNAWTDIIKPDSWVVNYTVMAILVEDNGQPTPAAQVGADYRVQGVLTYTAPYIPVTGLLTTAFEATNQSPVTTSLPRFPGQPLGDLVLNVFATRSGAAGTASRRLQGDDNWIVVMIYRDGHIELRTARDAPAELSTEGNMLSLLQMLR